VLGLVDISGSTDSDQSGWVCHDVKRAIGVDEKGLRLRCRTEGIPELMPLKRIVLELLVICVACVPCCKQPDDAWDRVREAGVLRVGMDASFPPFEAVAADGELVGFDVDLARDLGQRMGVQVEFVPNLPYDGLYDALAVGRVDVVISALVINPNRTADFGYSDVYFDAGQVLVVPEAHSDITQMRDLTGCTVAVEFGTRGDLETREWTRRLGALTILHRETAEGAIAAVLAGEADAAIVDHVTALAWTSKNPELVMTEGTVTSEPYAIAATSGSAGLIREINRALASATKDGTLDQLVDKWLAAP